MIRVVVRSSCGTWATDVVGGPLDSRVVVAAGRLLERAESRGIGPTLARMPPQTAGMIREPVDRSHELLVAVDPRTRRSFRSSPVGEPPRELR
jgi:hypothetical protein